MTDLFTPSPKHKFAFGLWTVGNTGRDPFGEPTRPALSPAEIVDLLGEAGGVHGVNFHDNDLLPIDASEREAEEIKQDFTKALKRNKLRVCMGTTNLFSDPAFRDGAFTSSDAHVRAYAVHKAMRGIDLACEFGASVYVFWGGREGAETDAGKDPVEAMGWFRQALNFLCAYTGDRHPGLRFALEAKPNEPRGHIYLPTTGHMLHFITTLENPDMVGVNPEVAHEHMAGLNFTHAVAQAIDAGKLFHIDLNDQQFGRYDQDFRFASVDPKSAFFLVKLLEDRKWDGFRHFDAHAYRSADRADVVAFARGCMRSYLILKSKAAAWNKDARVRELLASIRRDDKKLAALLGKPSAENAEKLRSMSFDRRAMASRPISLEALDQRTMEILLGATD